MFVVVEWLVVVDDHLRRHLVVVGCTEGEGEVAGMIACKLLHSWQLQTVAGHTVAAAVAVEASEVGCIAAHIRRIAVVGCSPFVFELLLGPVEGLVLAWLVVVVAGVDLLWH